MIQVICDFCGQKMNKEFVHKVEIKPWFKPKIRGHVYPREFDACTACAKAIEHRLITIENNYLWRGKDPDRRYRNWTPQSSNKTWHTDNPPEEDKLYLITSQSGALEVARWTNQLVFMRGTGKWHWIVRAAYTTVKAWTELPPAYMR